MTTQDPGWLSRQIAEHAPDAIVVADREGIIRLRNAAASAVLGYPVAEAAGHSLDVIIPEQFRARHWEDFGKVMQTGWPLGRSRYSLPPLAGGARRSG